jgi:hypothetical protein
MTFVVCALYCAVKPSVRNERLYSRLVLSSTAYGPALSHLRPFRSDARDAEPIPAALRRMEALANEQRVRGSPVPPFKRRPPSIVFRRHRRIVQVSRTISGNGDATWSPQCSRRPRQSDPLNRLKLWPVLPVLPPVLLLLLPLVMSLARRSASRLKRRGTRTGKRRALVAPPGQAAAARSVAVASSPASPVRG